MSRTSPAGRRYLRRFVPAMVGYVLVLFGVSAFVRGPSHPTGPSLWLAAALPALPLLVVIWALGRYLVEETDEYLRLQLVRAMLWGVAAVMVASTVWGFLETFAGAPHAPAYFAFILFCAAMGAAQCVQKLRQGSAQ